MASINLKLLHTFLLVGEYRSFRRAADDLNRSPSAVSMQIRDLEEQIGVSLFLRTPQRVTLTPEGKALLNQVRRTVREIQIGLNQLTDAASRRRGLIKMACAPTIAATRLPNILANFKVRFPSSVVQLRELSTAPILDLLRNQEIEFGLGPPLNSMDEFHFDPILHDPLYACVPPIFDDGRKNISLADLEGKPCVLLSPATTVRSTIDAAVEELGISLDVQFEVQQGTTAMAMAATGLGIAIVPKICLVQANTLQFRVIPLSDASARRDIGIITLRGYVPHHRSEQLINLIKDSLKEDA
jgi:DNA-binding transcriptional LysR family regulator